VKKTLKNLKKLSAKEKKLINTKSSDEVMSATVSHSAILGRYGSAPMVSIEGSTNINIQVWGPNNMQDIPRRENNAEFNINAYVFRRSPTISKMMASREKISPAFLDKISESFGSRWRALTVLLEIDQIFVERMWEDNFTNGGTKEVLYKVLSRYMTEHEEASTIGPFITFLWKNEFRQSVFTIKNHYKQLKMMDDETF